MWAVLSEHNVTQEEDTVGAWGLPGKTGGQKATALEMSTERGRFLQVIVRNMIIRWNCKMTGRHINQGDRSSAIELSTSWKTKCWLIEYSTTRCWHLMSWAQSGIVLIVLQMNMIFHLFVQYFRVKCWYKESFRFVCILHWKAHRWGAAAMGELVSRLCAFDQQPRAHCVHCAHCANINTNINTNEK